MQARFAFAQTQPLQRMPFPVALHGQQGDIAIGVSAARKAEAFLIFPQRQLDGELSKRHILPVDKIPIFRLASCSFAKAVRILVPSKVQLYKIKSLVGRLFRSLSFSH